VAVFGDLHGAVHSFIRELQSLERMGYLTADLSVAPAHAHDFFMVFCGDYVDRGLYGVEVMALLLTLRIRNPSNVFMVRGNHEDKPMNDQPGSGGFTSELHRKFPDAGATSADPALDGDVFGLVWRVYETLPAALFLGVAPDAVYSAQGKEGRTAVGEDAQSRAAQGEEGRTAVGEDAQSRAAEGVGTQQASITADGAAQVGVRQGGPGSLPPHQPQAYLMAVHGGIELGVDLWPFLAGDEAGVTAADVISLEHMLSRQADADVSADPQKASNDEDGTDSGSSQQDDGVRGSSGGTGSLRRQRGPIVQYSSIAALRRKDWLATAPEAVRERVPGYVRGHLHNYGPSAAEGNAGAAFERHRRPGGNYPAGDDVAGPYPARPLETDPANGFMWNDFFVHSREPFLEYDPGRGLIFGHGLTAHWLADNRIAGILRAHQHNDSPRAGPMLSEVRAAGGVFDNWGGSGMVLTTLSGGHIPSLSFPHDSFSLLALEGEAPAHWRLQHCHGRSRKQFIRVGGKAAAGGDASAPSSWDEGRVPPPELLRELLQQGAGGLRYVCNPDDTDIKCTDHGWRAGGFTPGPAATPQAPSATGALGTLGDGVAA